MERPRPRASPPVALVIVGPAVSIGLILGAPGGGPAGATTLLAGTAYVTNWASNSVTPINTTSNVPGTAIHVGSEPDAIAITPNGATAYVANWGSNNVTPINLATGKAGKAIGVGLHPDAIAITPDGTTAYVANFGSSSVTPINLSKNKAGASIGIDTSVHPGSSTHPDAIAIAPLGSPVYVTSQTWGNVVEINTFDNHVQGTPTGVRTDPTSITISPDGTTSYVTNFSADTVTPITTATGTRGTAIPVGAYPRDVAVSPDGATAYVTDFAENLVTPINTAGGTAGTAIFVGTSPMGLAVTPDGSTVYVANSGSNTVTPIDTATSTPGAPIHVGKAPDAIAITPGWTDQSTVTWPGPNGGPTGVAKPSSARRSPISRQAVRGLDRHGERLRGVLFELQRIDVGDRETGGLGRGQTRRSPVQRGAVVGSRRPEPDPGVEGSLDRGGERLVLLVQRQALGSPAATDVRRHVQRAGDHEHVGLPFITWTDGNDTVNSTEKTGLSTWSAPTKVLTAKGDPIITPYGPAVTFSTNLDTLIVAWTNANNTIGYLPLDDRAAQGTVPAAPTPPRPRRLDGRCVYVAWEAGPPTRSATPLVAPHAERGVGLPGVRTAALTNATPSLA